MSSRSVIHSERVTLYVPYAPSEGQRRTRSECFVQLCLDVARSASTSELGPSTAIQWSGRQYRLYPQPTLDSPPPPRFCGSCGRLETAEEQRPACGLCGGRFAARLACHRNGAAAVLFRLCSRALDSTSLLPSSSTTPDYLESALVVTARVQHPHPSDLLRIRASFSLFLQSSANSNYTQASAYRHIIARVLSSWQLPPQTL